MSEKLTTLSQLRAVSQKSKDRAAQVADTAAAALDEMDEVKADKTEPSSASFLEKRRPSVVPLNTTAFTYGTPAA